ncbi:choline transporter Hnm1, putative [Aspergillus fumigatus Af293]|uniref:Choline transporter Hnm1, putative n=1 Tax=Aspergillus fumigatus (strain ATCC MYA-4609 / CBS 101355 / FGSC A1100 / Af293) TaxID=330879 RepID=Q4WCC5_ASPFU|nr:choline transporter Hnm1, putative [Aspergillus fumigatus Af293]EAL85259.1 choline transporter Hnm1, putative [Aspergillus fumigatus Af293]KEY78351.1 choline transporter Hnm1 [Aspergillus fumigatus]
MGDSKMASPVADVVDDHGANIIRVQNADELRLAQMGLGLGLITSINAGGPGALIYGFILVFILQCFLATSLAEFVSAYPVEGGMYHWIAAIAPKRYNSILSFATGWSTVFGWIFTTASTNLIYATNFMALIALYKTDLVIQPWMTFVAYQGFNILTGGTVMFGNRFIPLINKFSFAQVCYLQLAWFVIMVTVAAAAPKHNDSEFVFRTWMNNTGWENNVICFITGLVNPLYSLGGLDGITHITEEMPNPGRNAPLALGELFPSLQPLTLQLMSRIACTLGIAFVTGLTYLLSLMYSVQDYSSLASTQTGLPLAEIFRQATQTRGGAFALTFMLWVALGPCMLGSQLSTGRVFWAFARDGGLPFSRIWAKVNPHFETPFNAQLCVGIITALLGCIYLGSSTAFNAMMSSAVTINNLAYLVPILTNVLVGRRTMHHGPFYLGHAPGMAVNIITVAWLVFAIVFFSFPYYMPVTAANMNYTCVCVGGFLLIALLWWVVAGDKYSKNMQKAREEEQNAARAMMVTHEGKE